MRPAGSRWRHVAAVLTVGVLAGCSGADPGPAHPGPTIGTPTADASTTVPDSAPSAAEGGESSPPVPRGLVYRAGRRARTGELLLFAEQTDLRGRADLLAAARAATTGDAADPDHSTPWSDDAVVGVRLLWDGDEGYYEVRLRDDAATRRPPGTSMRQAHLAIQEVVWTLGSVGRVAAPVRFQVRGSAEPVTDLLGVPATGPYDAYVAAYYQGVLSSMNILAPTDGTVVDGPVVVSGLGDSFEGTVGIRVTSAGGEVVVDDSTQTDQCCGPLLPWSYRLDTSDLPPGTYTVSALTDDPVGIENGSDGPEIDTTVIEVR